MEIEQLQLWARWLELQRDRAMAVLELEAEEEAAQVRRRRRPRRSSFAGPFGASDTQKNDQCGLLHPAHLRWHHARTPTRTLPKTIPELL